MGPGSAAAGVVPMMANARAMQDVAMREVVRRRMVAPFVDGQPVAQLKLTHRPYVAAPLTQDPKEWGDPPGGSATSSLRGDADPQMNETGPSPRSRSKRRDIAQLL
ncbi:hypothetical protein GCM10012286_63040 [Streptomyces lasiicapitis]|uniref:Uncharacterized protein n=1 Tax=Streptomyces lasiicapitis TaxID=1923961 RepID=A0ABQ2MK86_9ACTN|nr:hypothetical protein GCM10012286_63040 [Streptomyces lasiicapitis]